jgi:hypothetical protein
MQANITTESQQKKDEFPKVKVSWIRFQGNLLESYKRPTAYLIQGTIGAGKSSLGENIGFHFPKIIDLFGSRDNEALGWCRSPYKDSILLLKGVSTDVTSPWPCKNIVDLKLEDFRHYKVLLSCSAFYGDIREEWYSLSKLMDKLWHRTSWTDPWALLIREGANLVYSRLALGETQQQAKNYIIYVLREMRHCGYAVIMDALRTLSIDIDLRNIADFTFFKAQGTEGLPDNLHFLYKFFDPLGFMRMSVDQFAVLTRKGAIGYGEATYPFWHKEEKEDLLNMMDIHVAYRDMPDMGVAGHVGDFEHVKIIDLRKQGNSMEKTAELMGRSSRTVLRQINYHNQAVQGLGQCDRCLRAKGPLSKEAMM